MRLREGRARCSESIGSGAVQQPPALEKAMIRDSGIEKGGGRYGAIRAEPGR